MNDKEPRHCVSGLFRFLSNPQGDGMRRKDDITITGQKKPSARRGVQMVQMLNTCQREKKRNPWWSRNQSPSVPSWETREPWETRERRRSGCHHC